MYLRIHLNHSFSCAQTMSRDVLSKHVSAKTRNSAKRHVAILAWDWFKLLTPKIMQKSGYVNACYNDPCRFHTAPNNWSSILAIFAPLIEVDGGIWWQRSSLTLKIRQTNVKGIKVPTLPACWAKLYLFLCLEFFGSVGAVCSPSHITGSVDWGWIGGLFACCGAITMELCFF